MFQSYSSFPTHTHTHKYGWNRHLYWASKEEELGKKLAGNVKFQFVTDKYNS